MVCGECGKSDPTLEDGHACPECAAAAPPPFVPGWGAARSPNGLAQAVLLLLGAVILTDVASIVTGVLEYRFAGDLLDGSAWSARVEAEGERLDDWYGQAGDLQVYTFAVTAILFLVWFFRVRRNAEVFEPHGHTLARPWVVFGFVVPIANLWYPRRVAADVWDASAREDRTSHALLNWWWAGWLVASNLGFLADSWSEGAKELSDVQDATAAVVFTDALDIVAAVLAMRFVRALTRLQNRKVLMPPAGPAGAPFA
ncbi:DUF4328 domain-containing protein [Streptomyces sp. NPDC050145]|uniref:DUF4328 domain-containing protein n=1 Tax=Streptomyces sp. NPDC050145 TaxID=3365602 RepID=UPI003797E37F